VTSPGSPQRNWAATLSAACEDNGPSSRGKRGGVAACRSARLVFLRSLSLVSHLLFRAATAGAGAARREPTGRAAMPGTATKAPACMVGLVWWGCVWGRARGGGGEDEGQRRASEARRKRAQTRNAKYALLSLREERVDGPVLRAPRLHFSQVSALSLRPRPAREKGGGGRTSASWPADKTRRRG
jgi:hypothetical protein